MWLPFGNEFVTPDSCGADQAALAEARALTDELRATRYLAAQQVRLEVQRAPETLEVADASLGTALKRAEAAEAGFRIASRKRDLGQINQTEFIDARRTMTDARLNPNRVRAEFLARIAELEYAVGDPRAAHRELPMRFPVIGAGLAATLFLAACSDAPPPAGSPQTQAAPVHTAPAEDAAVTDVVRAVGILVPRDELRLPFKVGGVIGTRMAAGA